MENKMNKEQIKIVDIRLKKIPTSFVYNFFFYFSLKKKQFYFSNLYENFLFVFFNQRLTRKRIEKRRKLANDCCGFCVGVKLGEQ